MQRFRSKHFPKLRSLSSSMTQPTHLQASVLKNLDRRKEKVKAEPKPLIPSSVPPSCWAVRASALACGAQPTTSLPCRSKLQCPGPRTLLWSIKWLMWVTGPMSLGPYEVTMTVVSTQVLHARRLP